MSPSYWLFKTEPETYSYTQLEKDRKTNWNDVRNFQARNFLKQVSLGDLALIYHSGKERAIVGVAEVVREAYPDPDEDRDDWAQLDVKALKSLSTPVPLAKIKEDKILKEMLLVRQSRLSCMPVTPEQFRRALELGGISI